MKKFECNACGIRICTAEYQSGSGIPFKCTTESGGKAIWREIKELPKLTTEVFDRPDCPEWAKYAAVDKDGRGFYYHNKPRKNDYNWGLSDVVGCKLIDNFDPSHWQNSLIERPAKTHLPDWCKVGEWVYQRLNKKYIQIGNLDMAHLAMLEADIKNGATVQACKRPFNDKEMKALVGKVIEDEDEVNLVSCFHKDTGKIETDYESYDAESLKNSTFTIDGKPCYKLEHLENGEWVE